MPTISSSPPSFPSSSILFDFCFKRDWTSASSLLSSSFSPSSLLPLVLHKDVGGATALHRAVHWYAPVDLVKAILHVPVAASAEQAAAAAADPEQAAPLLLSPLTKRMLTARTMDGYSPLHLYCKDTPGDSLVFELLASLYPPALLLTDKSGRTPSALLLSSSDPALDPSLRERCLTLEAAERSRQRVSLNQRSVSFCLASLSRRDPSLLDPPTLSNHNKLPFASFTSRVLLFFSVREPGITSIIVSFVGVSGRSSSSSTASSRCHRKRDGGAPKQVNSLKAKYQSLLSAVVPSNWCAEAFADPFLPLVLDLGCGGGEWLLALADRLPSHNHLGLEIREEAVADCEREAAGRGNLSYLCCNVLAGDLQRVMGLLKGEERERSRERCRMWRTLRERERRFFLKELIFMCTLASHPSYNTETFLHFSISYRIVSPARLHVLPYA